MGPAWRIEKMDGVPVVRCAPLRSARGIAHGFSLRHAAGDDRFDAGSVDDGRAEVKSRRRRFLRAAGFGDAEPAILRQVHGSEVVRVHGGSPCPGDGALWAQGDPPGLVPVVRTADCVAIVLADRIGRAAACLHAGWKGTVGGIAGEGVRALEGLGVPPDDLLVALGPAILACCYEVGEEVAAAVASKMTVSRRLLQRSAAPGRFLLDLHLANRIQLERAGVPADAIHEAPWCTRCRGDLFFSFRREGDGAGRQMAAVGPSAEP